MTALTLPAIKKTSTHDQTQGHLNALLPIGLNIVYVGRIQARSARRFAIKLPAAPRTGPRKRTAPTDARGRRAFSSREKHYCLRYISAGRPFACKCVGCMGFVGCMVAVRGIYRLPISEPTKKFPARDATGISGNPRASAPAPACYSEIPPKSRIRTRTYSHCAPIRTYARCRPCAAELPRPIITKTRQRGWGWPGSCRWLQNPFYTTETSCPVCTALALTHFNDLQLGIKLTNVYLFLNLLSPLVI